MPRYTPETTRHMTQRITILCDGEELSDVFEPDDDLGFAVVGVRKDGGFVMENGGIKRKLVVGNVQVMMADG